MPFCPNCKSEYGRGADVCVDCGAKLVEEKPYVELPDYLKSVGNYILTSFKYLIGFLQIKETRRRVLLTLGIIAIYRLGITIPCPGVDGIALSNFFHQSKNSIMGLLDLFSGGAFERFSIFSLGIMPYITATWIFQLLVIVFSKLEKIHREEGWRIDLYIKYTTVVIAIIQALGLAIWIESIQTPNGVPFALNPGIGFKITTILTLTTATIFLVWLAEQISKHGIGSGISLIIWGTIISNLPNTIIVTLEQLLTGGLDLATILAFLGVILFIIAIIVAVSYGECKIKVDYPKQIQDTYLSLQTNFFGIIGIGLATSILAIPSTIITFCSIPGEYSSIVEIILKQLNPGGILYHLLEFIGIIFFTYVWASIILNPTKITDTLAKYGGYIPKTNLGEYTMTEYIERILGRVILLGIIFIWLISILFPILIFRILHLKFYIGVGAVSLIHAIAIPMYIWFVIKERLLIKNSQEEYVELKEVFVHYHLGEILAVKGLLESNGIKVTLDWEVYGRIIGLNVGLLGEKRLLVNDEDYYKSIAIIQQSEEDSFVQEVGGNSMFSKLSSYIAKASELYDAGKYEESLNYFDEAIKLDSENAELYNKRGLVLKEIREFDAALKDFENAISLKEDNVTAYLNAGDILHSQRRWQQAIECYDKAISFDPNNAEAFCNKALALEELEEYDEALKCYNKAIELSPTKIDFYNYKGILLHEDLKRYEEALKCYNKALELDPDNAETYHFKGDLFIELEKLQEALECFTKAIELSPNDKDLYDKKGWILDTLGKGKEAIKYYDKSITLDPSSDYPYYNKARIYAVLNERQLAIENLEKAIELNPENRKRLKADSAFNIIRKDVKKTRNPWLSALLSLLLPGLGQIYNGQMKKAIMLCLLFFSEVLMINILVSLFPLKAISALIASFLFIPILLITFIYIIIEAFITARKIGNNFILQPYNRWYVYLIIYIISLIIPTPELHYDYKRYKIPSEAMRPTLEVGDHIFVNKSWYRKTEPKRGDLIVFKYPEDPRWDFIKRVIGLPEEEIMIKDKKVYINGKELKEPYKIHTDSFSPLQSPRDNFEKPITIPQNHYFVLGDNRDSSLDSRFWGTVPKELIKGKVFMIYWPPWRFGELK